jgi:hypothetical protein
MISKGIEAGPISELKSRYDTDFLAWSKQQTEALRVAMRNGSNQHLDLGNLAAEIEDLGKSVRQSCNIRSDGSSAISSNSSTHQQRNPAVEARESIVDARAEIEDLLEASRSVRTELARNVEQQMQRGIDLVLRDFGRHQEIDRRNGRGATGYLLYRRARAQRLVPGGPTGWRRITTARSGATYRDCGTILIGQVATRTRRA